MHSKEGPVAQRAIKSEQTAFGTHPMEVADPLQASPAGNSRSPQPFQLSSSESQSPAPSDGEVAELFPASPEKDAEPIQAKMAASGPLQLQKPKATPVMIRFTGTVSQERFKQIAMKQLFGGPRTNLNWTLSKQQYTGPVRLLVANSLLNSGRSTVNKEKGIEVDASGNVSGAAKRRDAFNDSASASHKKEIFNEIDARYYEVTGDKPGTKIGKGPEDAGKRELWLKIQDEVLFQSEYLKNLPPAVKKFIKKGTSGRVLQAKDYEQLFRIAKMVEGLDPKVAIDYLSKVSASTTDLDEFERSLHSYQEQRAKDKVIAEDNRLNKEKLAGLDAIYKRYRTYKTMVRNASGGPPEMALANLVILNKAEKIRQELEVAVKQQGFADWNEFLAYITKFEKSFEKQSQIIVLNYLDKLNGRLFQESNRYKDQKEIQAVQAKIKAGTSKADLAKTNPIFEDSSLPEDKQIKLADLKSLDTAALGRYLQKKVAERQGDVKSARAEIQKDSRLVYKLDKMLPQMFAQQGIQPGSIHQMIIEDKIKDDAIMKIVVGIATAVVAIALAVVSLGTAVPGIVAASAAVAGFGMSAVMAFEEYKNYALENKLANAGLANEPGLVWLIIAVLGAALDLGAAARAIKALGASAKGLSTLEDLAKLEKAVAAAEAAGKIDAKISKAVIMAAKARVGYHTAKESLETILANGKGAKNLLDPKVYKALVEMGTNLVRSGVIHFSEYLLSVMRARKVAKISGDLSPEELLKVKQAWAEARALADVPEQALKGADAVLPAIKKGVMEKIARVEKAGSFVLQHSDEELRAIIAKGQQAGMTQREITDLIFTSARKDKPLSAIQIMDQMDFHKYLKSRGFPSKFKTLKEFEAFSSYMRDMYSKLGVPVNDIRIQGSAVRSPNAGDVDVVAMVDQATFDKFIKQAFNGKVSEKVGGKFKPIDLNSLDSAQLQALAERIYKLVKEGSPEAKNFNSAARGDFRFVYLAKMINADPFKKQFKNVFDLPGSLEALKKAFPHLNIDNFTIQVKGGFYDSYPFMNIK